MADDARLRMLIGRLVAHRDSAMSMDYGRIEELCWLIREEMFGEIGASSEPTIKPREGILHTLRSGTPRDQPTDAAFGLGHKLDGV